MERLHLLRSYKPPEKEKNVDKETRETNFTSEQKMEIWQVARAATAAPMYFGEFTIASKINGRVYYSDGGFGLTNNPTQEGIRELHHLHRRREGEAVVRGAIGTIVSIGTARAKNRPGGKNILRRIKDAFDRATNTQNVADAVAYDVLSNYWRFNDTEGIKVELDDWKPNKFSSDPGHKTRAEIKTGFQRWLSEWSNSDDLKACARELVRRRRARTDNRSKWERFATVAEFRCSHYECREMIIGSRDDFEEHFESKHLDEEYGEAHKKPGETTWTYPDSPPPVLYPNGKKTTHR